MTKKPPLTDIYKSHASDCTIGVLPISSAQDFFNLHLDVYWNLPATKQHFYKRLRYGQLKASLANGSSKIIGVTAPDGKTLLAGARLTWSSGLSPEIQKQFSLINGPINDGNSAVIQSLSAHPKTNGHGGQLIAALFNYAAQVAEADKKEWILGKLSWGNQLEELNNYASFKTFNRNGYSVIDPPSKKGIDFYKSIIVARNI